MAADAVPESAVPNLNLNPEEKRVYGQLFRQADTDNVGVVTGEIAVKFFDKTRLDSRVLGEIWQIADKQNRGFLTPAGFGIVLRLIGHAQAGREPTAELALQQGPIPRFDGFGPLPGAPAPPPAPIASPPPPAALQAQGTGGPIRIPPLTPEKVNQYAGLFEHQPLQNGTLLAGDAAKQIFEKSGLPNEILGRIWQLADTEQRGALVLTEFVIAMHLLTSMKMNTLRALPSILPAGLYEAATRRGPAGPAGPAPRQSPTSTGISAIPRQMSGSAQMRTGSPLGRPPMAPPVTAQSTGGAGDWAVSPTDKARFDQIYADLDKAHKGYITGEEAVPFFSQSNLPEDTLAQIWDLADSNSQGHLTRDQFAVAMYLIRQQRSGRTAPLPSTLPPNLIPPSLRNQARPPTATTSAFDAPPPVAQPPPPPQPKSALDDLFGLDSGTSSPVPPVPAPAQTTMSTGGSANDPFAGGSNILTPSSPIRPSPTGNNFKPFVPSSSFGRGLTTHGTGGSSGSGQRQVPMAASDDLLGETDEASKNISGDATELANLSNQISSLSKQTQDVQAKRTTTHNELNQANSQKANFEQRLAQLRTLYEKEAQDTRALEEQLSNARSETKKLQGECMSLEGTYQDIQTQHQQVLTQLQADQQENTNLRERIRVVNGEISQLKPQIEKLKLEARQQKGLVAINKKQLSTTEGERDKLKAEAEDLTKSNEDLSRQAQTGSPVSASAQIASPAASTASGNNPFFRRTASTDIMGAFASPPAKNISDRSFDDVFGPSFPASSSGTPPPPVAFKSQNTGASSASVGSFSTPPASSPVISRQPTLAVEPPPAPPESQQISSSFLPFVHHNESLSSSRQVSPPASRADDPIRSSTPFSPELPTSGSATSIPGTFPGDEHDKTDAPSTTTAPTDVSREVASESLPKPPAEESPVKSPDPFGPVDEDKAKADFENAFAAFTSAKTQSKPAPETAQPTSVFATEFPPISELERDDDSDSSSDRGGFDDDFAPASPPSKKPGESRAIAETAPAANGAVAEESRSSSSAEETEQQENSTEQPSSPATITNITAPQTSSMDDIFGVSNTAVAPTNAPAPSNLPQSKGAFEDLEDDFEGLEDAKEGSVEDDFANISRSGLDDFNPVFDSSPPASQTKSESTAFGNESSFDFVSAPQAPANGAQQKGAENHDWDAIFSGFDPPTSAASPPPATEQPSATETAPERPQPSRLETTGEHDDPILKNLTGMGYSRADAVSALEKYDYNLERAANFLASQS
ncbi:Fc.00g015550.m01.CDS01 [Cosmosporella sp. VM-42]